MNNQSIVAIPPNVEDPTVLKRFLARLVEQLDVVVGNRASLSLNLPEQEKNILASKNLIKDLQQAQLRLEELVNATEDLSSDTLLTLASRIDAIELKNNAQDTSIDAIELKNNAQDTSISNLQSNNASFESRLSALESAGYLTDAPADGNKYVRLNNAWVEIV